MSVVNLNSSNFDDYISSSKIPVVVDFWAAWCGPCKMMGPVLDELAEQYEGKIVVAKVNVDDDPALAMKYAIESIPAVKLFKDGILKDESIGFKPKPLMEKWIQSNL